MKNSSISLITSTLLLGLFLFVSTSVEANKIEESTIWTFTNSEEEDANDLHIVFFKGCLPTNFVIDAAGIKRAGGVFTSFPNQGSPTHHDYDGGTVADGESITLQFDTKPKPKKWWWTKDGVRIGKVKNAASEDVDPVSYQPTQPDYLEHTPRGTGRTTSRRAISTGKNPVSPKWMIGGDYSEWSAQEITFSNTHIEKLYEGIYSNAELTEKLLESLGGEFFPGTFSAPPQFSNYSYTNPRFFGLNTSVYFDRHFGFRVGAAKGSSSVSAEFPITVIDLEKGDTRTTTGQVIHDRNIYSTFAQMQYILFEGYLRMMIAAGVHYECEQASTIDAIMGQQRFSIQALEAQTNWYPNAELGFQLQLSNRLVAEASAKARKVGDEIEYGAGVGLYFALVK